MNFLWHNLSKNALTRAHFSGDKPISFPSILDWRENMLKKMALFAVCVSLFLCDVGLAATCAVDNPRIHVAVKDGVIVISGEDSDAIKRAVQFIPRPYFFEDRGNSGKTELNRVPNPGDYPHQIAFSVNNRDKAGGARAFYLYGENNWRLVPTAEYVSLGEGVRRVMAANGDWYLEITR